MKTNLLLAALLLGTAAQAPAKTVTAAECESLSQFAYTVAVARDKGTPERDTLAKVDSPSASATYAAHPGLHSNLAATVAEIYSNPKLTPEQARTFMLQACSPQ